MLIFAVFAVIAIGGLVFQVSGSDATGAAPYSRTVERGVPSECQSTNDMMMKITRDVEIKLNAYEEIYQYIYFLLDIQAQLLKITNTRMKAAVLTCDDWKQLVPGITKVMSCDEIDRVYDEERRELVVEGKTCGGGDQCVDVFPWAECNSGPDKGDKSVACNCEPVRSGTRVVDRCVPQDDPKLWVFQKNVWTLKKLLLKIKLELEAEYERIRELNLEIKEHLEVWIKMDGQLKDCIKRRCVTDCPRTVPRDRVSTPQETVPRTGGAVRLPPRDQVTTPQPQLSCEEVCSREGLSVTPPSSSSILAELQQYECVSGASIRIGTKTVGDCKCYGKPKIDVNKKKPVCDTPCGKLACGESTSCPCPDGRENCVMHAQCSWGGWKDLGNYRFAPQLGKASGHLS